MYTDFENEVMVVYPKYIIDNMDIDEFEFSDCGLSVGDSDYYDSLIKI